MARGQFITIEGGEGSGKSTLIAALARQVRARGHQVLTTREPGGTPLAEEVRALALNPPADSHWSAMAEALLMNAARADHVEKKIAPALEAGIWVICDRFADSTRVYQGLGGAPASVLLAIQEEVTRNARPNLTLILDAPAEALIERRRSRGAVDVFESRPVSFHEQVRQGFLAIAERDPQRCLVLDALSEPEDLLQEAISAIEHRLVLA